MQNQLNILKAQRNNQYQTSSTKEKERMCGEGEKELQINLKLKNIKL